MVFDLREFLAVLKLTKGDTTTISYTNEAYQQTQHPRSHPWLFLGSACIPVVYIFILTI